MYTYLRWYHLFGFNSVEYVITVLEKVGLTQMKNSDDVQIPETFKMDHLLPYFIHIYPKNKSEFLKNIPLFQKHLLILQVGTYIYSIHIHYNIIMKLFYISLEFQIKYYWIIFISWIYVWSYIICSSNNWLFYFLPICEIRCIDWYHVDQKSLELQ